MHEHDWDPAQYRRFASERALPFWELLGLVQQSIEHSIDRAPVRRLVDLGCGDGQLTNQAARRFACAVTLGIDSSPAMLASARASEASAPNTDVTGAGHGVVEFVEGDIGRWPSTVADAGPWDLVLANASLQWVPDHASVLAQWTGALAPGGQLAVQVPANGDHASHVVANEVGNAEPFLSALGGQVPNDPTASNVLAPERYAAILHDLGYEAQHVGLRVYPHVLASSADVVEWVRGTNLNRFLTRLPPTLHEPFLDAYSVALLRRIGDRSPYLYTYKRILAWARLPG